MAKILIGWELGANRGHLSRMLRYHDALAAAGHEVALASQRIDGIAGEGRQVAGRVWQAPVWPRLLGWAAARSMGAPATLGDILARLGLAEPGVLGAVTQGWEAILAAERPDVVVAEYAPSLLCATRGRVPAIAIGIGFDLPPAGMPAFPSLTGGSPQFDEAALLATANADLAGIGRPALPALPALFAAERALPAGLDEIDPYAGHRPGGMSTPLVDLPLAALGPPEGEDIFVYWPERGPASLHMWRALAATGLPVRVHIPRLPARDAAELQGMGMTVEPRPVPFAEIARQSRLLLSHGGAGFVINGMLHGRPQIIVHFDLEKRNNGLALERLGLGAQIPLAALEVDAFARGMERLHGDAALSARAMALAGTLRDRMTVPAETQMLEAVAALV